MQEKKIHLQGYPTREFATLPAISVAPPHLLTLHFHHLKFDVHSCWPLFFKSTNRNAVFLWYILARDKVQRHTVLS